ASGVLRFTMRLLLNAVSRRIETDLRHDVFARLSTLDASWYARWRTGDLMARLTNDLGAVRMAAGPALMYFVNTIFGGLFAVLMMVRISPLLTAVALLPMIGLPLLMLRLGRLVHDRFEAVQSQFSQLTTRAQENLSGVRVVRAYRQEQAETARFVALGDKYLTANMRLATLNGVMNPGFGLLAGLGGAVTIGVGGRLLIQGQITVGGYVAFGIYLAQLTWPLIALGWTTNLFQRAAASMTRVLELLDAVPLSVQDTGTANLPIAVGHSGAQQGGRTVEFRHVSFRYPRPVIVSEDGAARDANYERTPDGETAAASRWILYNVSFCIPAGGTLAIVGATGSGKSALMDLIPRVFEPQEGQILLDGVDIRDLPIGVLRAELGYVPQEALLFSETVGENIGYGLEAPDHQRLEHAAGIAQLRNTIADLPYGFDTRLGERGINLSGGQKQRMALARALARAPRVVLLDDALSAVDTQTEAAILYELRTALHGRTALIASHRVSAVREADHILVLDEGRIVEQGTHDDLVRLGGCYTQLLQRQQLLEAIEAA
ncbi:ABC transporter ATP-binding protein, partial [Gemmatimonas sp.]|uniref:ABC transporter ATP-binding protein n=2 Tax=Gemmatimonas sp. TaxID=1962908 RepID=UPI0035620E0E